MMMQSLNSAVQNNNKIKLAVGFEEIDGKLWHFEKNGYSSGIHAWFEATQNGRTGWYYCAEEGVVATGFQDIGEERFYFAEKNDTAVFTDGGKRAQGELVSNTWIQINSGDNTPETPPAKGGLTGISEAGGIVVLSYDARWGLRYNLAGGRIVLMAVNAEEFCAMTGAKLPATLAEMDTFLHSDPFAKIQSGYAKHGEYDTVSLDHIKIRGREVMTAFRSAGKWQFATTDSLLYQYEGGQEFITGKVNPDNRVQKIQNPLNITGHVCDISVVDGRYSAMKIGSRIFDASLNEVNVLFTD